MEETPTPPGAVRFIVSLAALGIDAWVDGPAVMYVVTPVGGTLAGTAITTGVNVNECAGWPTAPPHWIHVPVDIVLVPTNIDVNDTVAGFRRHSRDIQQWLTGATDPGQAWIAHVRATLGGAV